MKKPESYPSNMGNLFSQYVAEKDIKNFKTLLSDSKLKQPSSMLLYTYNDLGGIGECIHWLDFISFYQNLVHEFNVSLQGLCFLRGFEESLLKLKNIILERLDRESVYFFDSLKDFDLAASKKCPFIVVIYDYHIRKSISLESSSVLEKLLRLQTFPLLRLIVGDSLTDTISLSNQEFDAKKPYNFKCDYDKYYQIKNIGLEFYLPFLLISLIRFQGGDAQQEKEKQKWFELIAKNYLLLSCLLLNSIYLLESIFKGHIRIKVKDQQSDEKIWTNQVKKNKEWEDRRKSFIDWIEKPKFNKFQSFIESKYKEALIKNNFSAVRYMIGCSAFFYSKPVILDNYFAIPENDVLDGAHLG